MNISDNCIELIKKFEGCKLHAYPDPGTGGEPITIGFGTTRYPNGHKVRLGDVISLDQANEYLKHDVSKFASKITVNVNQNQFDALVSFAYNVGIGALNKSTLLKKVKLNPNDPGIRGEFLRWNRAAGKVLKGLTLRRQAEADLYFS